DRLSFAYTANHKDAQLSRIYIRLTGKLDHQRMIDAYKDLMPGVTVKEHKTFRGQRLTTIEQPNNDPPAMALVGDTDLLMCGFEGNRAGNHMDLLTEMLTVRSGKSKSVLTGPLSATLDRLSPQANGIFAGELPQDLRNQLTRGPEAFKGAPKALIGEML